MFTDDGKIALTEARCKIRVLASEALAERLRSKKI
jgi:hypothetical protein